MSEVLMGRIGDPWPAGVHRVLVDRLWPRGVRKETAPWDEWLPEVAPSTALRRWYGHDPARWDEFVARYRRELATMAGSRSLTGLLDRVRQGPVALVTATRDPARSQVPVLRAFLLEAVSGGTAPAGSEA